jgi:inner membrane protein
MDNITHTLTGVVLSRAGLNRITPHATLLMVLASNAADLDVVAALWGPAAYLRYHRGLSHSMTAMPLLALLVVALVRVALRKKFPLGRGYAVALIGVAANPLFDLMNSYGVRLLWPFSDRWFHADIIAIFDVWILLLLFAGLAAPWLLGIVSSEIGAAKGGGRPMAVFVLCAIAAIGFGRHLLHARAVAVLDSRVYQAEVPLRVGAFPTLANPFRWVGVVEGRDFFQVYPGLNVLEEFDPSQGNLHYKPDARPELERAGTTETFRGFLQFSQWTLWRVSPAPDLEGGLQVEAIDLRFGSPESPRFVASALFDSAGRLTRSSLRF